MARLRHAAHVRREHILASLTVVAAVGVGCAATLIGDAQAATGASVMPAPSGVAAGGAIRSAKAVPAVAAKRKAKALSPITNSGWRVPINKYTFSAVFGQAGSWSSGYHTGLDFVADEGSRVVAPTDGVVVATQYEGAYGNLVQLRTSRRMQIWFAHLSEAEVTQGERVKRGDLLGYVGMTGRTTGPHLHLEVRIDDQSVNPFRYFWPGASPQEFPNGLR